MPSPLPPPVPFSELYERVDNALDRWFSGPRGWLPAIDIVRRDGELVICADVPGMEPDDVKSRPVEDRSQGQAWRRRGHDPPAGSKKESLTINPIGG